MKVFFFTGINFRLHDKSFIRFDEWYRRQIRHKGVLCIA